MFSLLPARRYASAGNSDRNVSVCLSLCPSVCHVPVLCQNVMISSPSCSPTILEESKKGGVGKFSDFLALSVNISKTIGATSKVTISD